MALGVGMLKVTTSWSWLSPEKRASGGAGPRDLVLCAMGSDSGRAGALITLGGVTTASAKVRRRGAIGAGRMAGTGDLVSGGDIGGDGTLGDGWTCTLGGVGGCSRE